MQAVETQARNAGLPIPLLSVQSEMVRYLGAALRDLRKARKVRLIEVAYPLKKSEAAMSRFEGGRVTQPEAIDRVVDCYAEVLSEGDRPNLDVFEIWAEALKRWRETATAPTEDEARAGAAAALETEADLLDDQARRRAGGVAEGAAEHSEDRQRHAS